MLADVPKIAVEFLSTPSARRATKMALDADLYDAQFLSTPSARRATFSPKQKQRFCKYFYPRPPRGGRLLSSALGKYPRQFLSTPSARRATTAWMEQTDAEIFLSTPSARRATCCGDVAEVCVQISIHALREEGDCAAGNSTVRRMDFYPRPPRGGRPRRRKHSDRRTRFLSTPSARRATYTEWYKSKGGKISIHALREEGDKLHRLIVKFKFYFYPRPPRGGRHDHNITGSIMTLISIHALREEGDITCCSRSSRHSDFYPRPPRGGRPGIHRVVLFIK